MYPFLTKKKIASKTGVYVSKKGGRKLLSLRDKPYQSRTLKEE
jgi:hypothetical protein